MADMRLNTARYVDMWQERRTHMHATNTAYNSCTLAPLHMLLATLCRVP